MRIILVSLLVLTACERSADFGQPPNPAPIEPSAKPVAAPPPIGAPPIDATPPVPTPPPGRRANGLGFTIALPDGWEAQGVEGSSLFIAMLNGKGTFEIMRLPDADHDVPASARRCRAWAEKVAGGMTGTVHEAGITNGTCSGSITAKSLPFHIEAHARDDQYYASICTGAIDQDCTAMLASWRDDSTAKPARRERRITVAFENEHPVVRSKNFELTFPEDWHVTEGAGEMLLNATSSAGGVLAIAIIDDMETFDRAACEAIGPSLAQSLNGEFVSARLVRTPIGTACRVDMSRAIFGYVLQVKATSNGYLFGCGSSRGDVPEAACASILETWKTR